MEKRIKGKKIEEVEERGIRRIASDEARKTGNYYLSGVGGFEFCHRRQARITELARRGGFRCGLYID